MKDFLQSSQHHFFLSQKIWTAIFESPALSGILSDDISNNIIGELMPL